MNDRSCQTDLSLLRNKPSNFQKMTKKYRVTVLVVFGYRWSVLVARWSVSITVGRKTISIFEKVLNVRGNDDGICCTKRVMVHWRKAGHCNHRGS